MHVKDSNFRRKHMDVPFEIKSVGDDGMFSGYGSVFEVLDSYREVVKAGAFQKSIADWEGKGRMPPVLWNHDANKPIGVYTMMREDERGLYVEGKLLINEVQQARETHALLKAGAIGGMSIGYSVVKAQDADKGVRKLLELKLYEVSVVTFPANEAARVDAVKAALEDGELPTLRQFEKSLREQGFSKTQAELIAARGFKHLIDSGDPGGGEINAVRQALEILNS